MNKKILPEKNQETKEITKNPEGRPLAFKSVEELESKINEYFDYCDNKTKEIHSERLGDMIVPDPQPYGMAGLAYYLGVDRKTILNYSNKEEYFHTIKKAKARIESDIERRLGNKDTFTPGLIFNAKVNLGWNEEPKMLQQININDGEKGNSITFVNFTNEPES